MTESSIGYTLEQTPNSCSQFAKLSVLGPPVCAGKTYECRCVVMVADLYKEGLGLGLGSVKGQVRKPSN